MAYFKHIFILKLVNLKDFLVFLKSYNYLSLVELVYKPSYSLYLQILKVI